MTANSTRRQAAAFLAGRPKPEPPAEPTTSDEKQALQLRRMVGDLPEEGEE